MRITKPIRYSVLAIVLILAVMMPAYAQPTVSPSQPSTDTAILGELIKEVRDLKRIVTNEVKQGSQDIKSHTTAELDARQEWLNKEVNAVRSKLMIQLGMGVAVALVIGFIIVQLIAMKLRGIRLAITKKELEEAIKPVEQKRDSVIAELADAEQKLAQLKAELTATTEALSKQKSKVQPTTATDKKREKDLAKLKELLENYGLPEMTSMDVPPSQNIPPPPFLHSPPMPQLKRKGFRMMHLIIIVVIAVVAVLMIVLASLSRGG